MIVSYFRSLLIVSMVLFALGTANHDCNIISLTVPSIVINEAHCLILKISGVEHVFSFGKLIFFNL